LYTANYRKTLSECSHATGFDRKIKSMGLSTRLQVSISKKKTITLQFLAFVANLKKKNSMQKWSI
jgi:hypothetical protein